MGRNGVSHFDLENPKQTKPLLKWDTLGLKQLDLQVEPIVVNLQEVELVNPAAVFSIDAYGGMNLKRVLSELYVEKFGAQPKTPPSSEGKALGLPTPEQMKAKLLEGIQVEDEQLRLLAQQRAQGIQEYLIQEGKVPGDRVFLTEANLSPVTEEGTVRSPLSMTAN